MKHHAQQFDLAMSGETFSLVGEQVTIPLCQDCREIPANSDGLCEACAEDRREIGITYHRDLFQE